MPEVNLHAGEQWWSKMVSVVQSVLSLNKYRALLPDLVFPRRGCGMWLSLFYGLSELDDFMTLLCLRGIDGGMVQTLLARTHLWMCKVVRNRELEQVLVADGVQGSLLAAVGIGVSLCSCPQWLSRFAQSLHCFNYAFPFSHRKLNR